MSIRIRIVAPLLLLVLSLFVLNVLTPIAALADGPVEVLVYFSPKCDHCTLAPRRVLDPLSQEYGARIMFTYVDITQAAGLSQLEADRSSPGPTGQ